MIQFIHNLPGSEVVNLNLGDIQSGLSFRSATAYRPVGAGNLELTISRWELPRSRRHLHIIPGG